MKAHELNRADLRTMARAMMNRPLAAPGLVIGSSSKTDIRIANTIAFLINGAFKSVGSAFELSPGGDALGNSEKCIYLVSIAADGSSGSVTQSAVVAASDDDPDLPEVPADECPVGTVKVETDGSNTYTPGTDNLDATGVTASYTDMVWPDTGNDALGY
jgi:hypothetical protein